MVSVTKIFLPDSNIWPQMFTSSLPDHNYMLQENLVIVGKNEERMSKIDIFSVFSYRKSSGAYLISETPEGGL